MAAEAGNGGPFIDHYAFVGGDPDLTLEELKKLYHEKLREYHPDKRPESAGSTGQRITQALNEAWEVLRDPQKKEAYDVTWRREKERALPAHERADLHRRRGNELYGRARELAKDVSVMNLAAVHQSMKFYKSAMEEYSKAMESAPNDHRLYSNRALCYLAVEDWDKARLDSQFCTRLRPDFKKAWLLLTKALWKLGRMEEAKEQLQQGLRFLPGCNELLDLQADFTREIGDSSFRAASRSVSPVFTPTPSRNPTPPRASQTYSANGAGGRPVSPRLMAAGLAASERSPGGSHTYGGPSSRSPGPASRSPDKRRQAPHLDASGEFLTGNFGAPTPMFAAAGKMPPSHDAAQASFPSNAHTMWAGNSGNASYRSAYSPGPAAAGAAPGTARTSSHSPGPSFAGAPDLGASARSQTSGKEGGGFFSRKSASLRGMMESSTRSRGNTPPSRGPTPPRR